MAIVPASAKIELNGLTNIPPIAATAPPIQGPKIGIILSTPVIHPKAPEFPIPSIQNNRPDATPIIKH